MLKLRLSTRIGRVEISADQVRSTALQNLRGRFSTSTSIGSLAFDLDINDFLVNLRELASWPSDDLEIDWQPELVGLAGGVVADTNLMATRLAATEADAEPSLPAFGGGWSSTLTEFQSRDLAKLLELAHGANFSVPGAGKTRVALAVFQASRDSGLISRMLVVCPKSAFESWQIETRICYPADPPRLAVLDGSIVPPCDILLVNYERLADALSALIQWLRVQPSLVVLDEAHRMKLGPAGAWGAASLSLGPYARRRLVLTGTPAPNGAKDLENILSFVWPGQGRLTVQRALSGKTLREASTLLRPLFVRTTKNELGLPPVDRTVRRVVLPPIHRELYNALVGQMSNRWKGGGRDLEALGQILLYLLMAATTPALLATGATRYEPLPYRVPPLDAPPDSTLFALMRDLPHYEMSPKYQETLRIVADNAAAGRKTLVWSTFVRNLTSLHHLLDRFNPALVHGGTVDRDTELNRFRTDPSCFVLLSNPATLGEGISLHQVCHDAVYVDRDFAAGRFLQSLDRIHRLGLPPDTRTRITLIVAENTIDEIVEQRLASKLRFMGGVLDDPAILELEDLAEEPTASAGMNAADLQALIGYLTVDAPS